MLNSSKCVLLLSDEGINIYNVSSGKTSFIDAVPWETEDFEDSVAELLKHKSGGKPVVLLNDMVEQHYRKERIPKVNSLDRNSVIQNRLSAAFQSYPIRSALKLKDGKTGKAEAAGGNNGTYLFAAVPLSDSVRKTLDAVKKTHAPIAGFALLPVESSSMVQALAKKLNKGGKPSVWTVFVGQHQSGGLRQVVTRNGELALTRMTPIIDSDTDSESWTGEVAAEIKGTMSYLSRFGYDASDGLDIVVIANNSSADLLSSKVDFDCNLNILTVGEAGNLLGLRVGHKEEQRYADPLHVAWAGSKSKLTLPLKSPLLEQITRPAQIALAASIFLLAACLYLGYSTMNSLHQWTQYSGDLAKAEQTLAATRIDHDKEEQIKKDAGIDFLLIESAAKIFTDLEMHSMRPLGTLDIIGRSLGPDIHIQSLDIQPAGEPKLADGTVPEAEVPPPADVPATEGDATAAPKQNEYSIVIRIVFPGTLRPESGVKQINDLQRRLQANMPNHQVTVIKQVADLSYTGNFVGEASNVDQAQSGKKQDYEAQIMIKGALL